MTQETTPRFQVFGFGLCIASGALGDQQDSPISQGKRPSVEPSAGRGDPPSGVLEQAPELGQGVDPVADRALLALAPALEDGVLDQTALQRVVALPHREANAARFQHPLAGVEAREQRLGGGPRVDHPSTAGAQRLPHPGEESQEVLVGKVREAVSETDRAVEVPAPGWRTHVSWKELSREAEAACFRRRTLEGRGGEVDPGHPVAAPRERERMAPVSAWQIQEPAGRLQAERALDE